MFSSPDTELTAADESPRPLGIGQEDKQLRMIELQNEIVAEIAGCVVGDWDELLVHYENYVFKKSLYEIHASVSVLNGIRSDLKLSVEAIFLLGDLKGHRPVGQDEEWTWLELAVERSGKYKFHYKYGVPPLVEKTLKFAD
jgi:hypothetical protein